MAEHLNTDSTDIKRWPYAVGCQMPGGWREVTYFLL